MHSGEIQIAGRLKVPHNPYQPSYHPQMPLQHQIFFTDLPYFIFGNLDSEGRPWVSIITGRPGFVKAISPNHLYVNVETSKWDPISRNLQEDVGVSNSDDGRTFLFSGLGVDFSNRRRNKVAGIIEGRSIEVDDDGGDRVKVKLLIITQESLGNCPKYITVRSVKYSQRPSPQLVHDYFHVPPSFNGIPQDCVDTILQSDTIFISTRHYANEDDINPISDMDVNIRGGPRGFVRVLPGAKQIVWPDYSGNRLYQSLGNIESDHMLGMFFPNFTTGDALYITGTAENLIGEEATDLMPSCELVTRLTITGFVFIKNGLDLVLQSDKVEYSPYNPPVRYLRSEADLHPLSRDPTPTPITLTDITTITPNICTFTFTLPSDRPISYLPGQHILVDFSQAKPKSYSHMDEARPQRLNDDFVRSWTISSCPPASPSSNTFAPAITLTCTIKLKEQGEITPFLYQYASLPPAHRPHLNLSHRGVNGTFTIFTNPSPPPPASLLALQSKDILFIAGGIGITPFLSFHSALQSLHLDANFTLLFSCRNDELLLARPFFSQPSPPPTTTSTPLLPTLQLFQTGDTEKYNIALPNVNKRRMTMEDVAAVEAVKEKVVFLCGPDGFMGVVVEWLAGLGVPQSNIKQEQFNF